MGSLVVLGIFFLVMMLIVDLLYATVDPRLKGRFITGAAKKQKKAPAPTSKTAEGQA